jgi:hypothetical protein
MAIGMGAGRILRRLRYRRQTDNDDTDVPLRELAGQTRGTIRRPSAARHSLRTI